MFGGHGEGDELVAGAAGEGDAVDGGAPGVEDGPGGVEAVGLDSEPVGNVRSCSMRLTWYEDTGWWYAHDGAATVGTCTQRFIDGAWVWQAKLPDPPGAIRLGRDRTIIGEYPTLDDAQAAIEAHVATAR